MIYINPYRPVEKVSLLPSFCGKCGRKMDKKYMDRGFNQYTGQKLPRSQYVICPKGGFDKGHDAYIVDTRPETQQIRLPEPDMELLG